MSKRFKAKKKQLLLTLLICGTFFISVLGVCFAAADTVKIGLNYPKTGPYSVQGLDQLRAAELAA